MISEIEARACHYTMRRPVHPYRSGRILGPLIVGVAFLVMVVGGGIKTHLASVPPAQQAEAGLVRAEGPAKITGN